MIVASNTPASFPKRKGWEFVPLGDKLDETKIIVLMLEKNWGSANTTKINALTHWLNQYPKNVRCLLIGSEMTIPDHALADKSLARFRSKDRDEAIVNLCKEVLTRSVSVGVRGKLTKHFLVDVLGLDDTKVDVIHERDSEKNSELLDLFMEKNNAPIKQFTSSILRFQNAPKVIYERPVNFNNLISLSTPYKTYEGGFVRINCDFSIDGVTQTLWCETSSEWEDYLLEERADAFICAILPFAMRAGKDIVSNGAVTEHFAHNLKEILIPQLSAHDHRLYETKISATLESAALPSGDAVATGMSCGVDSLYTTYLYSSSEYKSINLTHLYCGNYIYGNDGPIYERAKLVSDKLNLPLVATKTNLNEVFSIPHVYTHFYKTMFGVLSLRKLFKSYLYSSAEDFSHFKITDNAIRDTAQFELLLLYSFSCPDFQVITGGGRSERLEKTAAICDFDVARDFLNVCLYPNNERNCGNCAKCMRTLLMIDMLGKLDEFSKVFDIENYIENRIESFVYLYKLRKSTMLSKVYDHFSKKEPQLLKEAEKIVNLR